MTHRRATAQRRRSECDTDWLHRAVANVCTSCSDTSASSGGSRQALRQAWGAQERTGSLSSRGEERETEQAMIGFIVLGGSDRAARTAVRLDPPRPTVAHQLRGRTHPLGEKHLQNKGLAAARWNREDHSSSTAQPCPVTRLLRSAALCSSVWEILERP